MGIDFWLPWPIYVLLITVACIAVAVYVVKNWNTEPKAYMASLILFAIAGLITAIVKIGKGLNFYQEESFLITILKIVAIPAVLLLIIGAHQKLINDPVKQKGFIIYIIVSLIILVVLYGLFLISLKM